MALFRKIDAAVCAVKKVCHALEVVDASRGGFRRAALQLIAVTLEGCTLKLKPKLAEEVLKRVIKSSADTAKPSTVRAAGLAVLGAFGRAHAEALAVAERGTAFETALTTVHRMSRNTVPSRVAPSVSPAET